MQEASKIRDQYRSILIGSGIDIGCGDDPILPGCMAWDLDRGDAQTMGGQKPETYDWVFSSHCLEHMARPLEALLTWWRLLKPLGLMVLIVPDEDAYEKGIWPSLYNGDHKATFTASKWKSWSPASRNLTDLIAYLPDHKLLALKIVDTTDGTIADGTTLGAKAQIECVLQKQGPVPELMTPLAQTITCPKCQGEVILIGKRKEGDLYLRCSRCGEFGTYNA